MASSSPLQLVKESGWRAGFNNMFSKENGAWWRTRLWLIQSIIWLVVLNGLLASVLRVPADTVQKAQQKIEADAAAGQTVDPTAALVGESQIGQGLLVFLLFGGLAVPVAAIILGMEAIVNEKQSGTAAWVLSKPVSRKAFILSKLAASALGILITCVALQSVLAYFQVSARVGAPYPLLPFMSGIGLVYLDILFYLTLTVMLGTLFQGRGPVLGISLALALGGPSIIRVAPKFIAMLLPWTFIVPYTPSGAPLALSAALGQPLESWLPVVATALWCIVFVVVALWRFEQEEF